MWYVPLDTLCGGSKLKAEKKAHSIEVYYPKYKTEQKTGSILCYESSLIKN